jgi:hypothetical protein
LTELQEAHADRAPIESTLPQAEPSVSATPQASLLKSCKLELRERASVRLKFSFTIKAARSAKVLKGVPRRRRNEIGIALRAKNLFVNLGASWRFLAP